MAKQTVSVIERHVEKGVLGVALACLIYVVVTNLLTTPNRIEVGGQTANPATIDRLVADKADDVRDMIRSSQPPPVDFTARAPEFKAANDPMVVANASPTWPRTVAFGLPVPEVGQASIAPGTLKLAPVVQLPKPRLIAGRNTVEFVSSPLTYRLGFRDDMQTNDVASDDLAVNWVTAISTFNADEQKKLNNEAYSGYIIEEPRVVEVQCQRRARRSDGSWNEQDWHDVKPYTIGALPAVEPIDLIVAAEGEIHVDLDDLDAIDRQKRLLKDGNIYVNLLRPMFPVVVDGALWPHPGIEVMAQDSAILFNEELRPSEYHDRYTIVKAVAPGTPKGPEGPPEGVNPREYISDSLKEFDEAFASEDENAQVAAYNKIFHYVKNAQNEDAAVVALAKETTDQINRLQADWRNKLSNWERENTRRAILGQAALPRPNPCDLLPPGRCPKAPEVNVSSSQTVWVHDAWVDSVKGGRTYQFRMRVVLLNPFAGQPKQLADKNDATKWFLEGAWSEPSDPIYVEPETQFWVKSASQSRGVSFDVFKWYRGVWVSSSFTVKPWGVVGGEARAKVPDDANPTPLVDFDTGVTVVDLDFDRRLRPRERAGREGIQFDEPESTVVVALMDASGEVYERLLEIDKDDPNYAKMKQRVYKPAPKPKEEPPPGPGPGPEPRPRPKP